MIEKRMVYHWGKRYFTDADRMYICDVVFDGLSAPIEFPMRSVADGLSREGGVIRRVSPRLILGSTGAFAATQGGDGRMRVRGLSPSLTSRRRFCSLSTITVKTTDVAN